MKLQNDDLLNYAKRMAKNTRNQYEIIANKGASGYWKLEIINNENGASETLIGGATTREAFEALRAVYATFRFLGI